MTLAVHHYELGLQLAIILLIINLTVVLITIISGVYGAPKYKLHP